eukprot:2436102-Prymnesium_polylepis.1
MNWGSCPTAPCAGRATVATGSITISTRRADAAIMSRRRLNSVSSAPREYATSVLRASGCSALP